MSKATRPGDMTDTLLHCLWIQIMEINDQSSRIYDQEKYE
jgi:hypothetical protein